MGAELGQSTNQVLALAHRSVEVVLHRFVSRRWRAGTAALVSSSAPGSLSWPAYAPSGRSVWNEKSGGSDYCVRAAAERDNANRQPVFVLGRGGDFSCRFRARGLVSSAGDCSGGDIPQVSLASVLQAASKHLEREQKRGAVRQIRSSSACVRHRCCCASLRARNAAAAERATHEITTGALRGAR